MIGTVIDKYEILQKIGEGGMATVYRARHLTLQREVAQAGDSREQLIALSSNLSRHLLHVPVNMILLPSMLISPPTLQFLNSLYLVSIWKDYHPEKHFH